MGRLSQPTKAPASKQQRPSLLGNPRLAAALRGSASKDAHKTRSPLGASRLSLGLLGGSKAGKQSPKGKLPSRFSLGAVPPPSQQHHSKARGRKSDPFPRAAPNLFKLSPPRGGRKSMPGFGGGGRTSALFGGGAKGFGFDFGASDDEADSDDESMDSMGTSAGGSEGGSDDEGGSGVTSDEEEQRDAGDPFDAPAIFVPDPALEKQMVRAVNRGPLLQGAARELASIEQVLSQSNETAKGLFITELGEGMTVELLKTIEAMEQRVQIGTNNIRQGKEKVIKELEGNFEQARTSIARLAALSDRLLDSRKKLSGDLSAMRDETSAKLETMQRGYHDTCVALKKQLQDGSGKKSGGAGGKKR